MYQYTDFDRQFIRLRAEQFRDQLERWQAGKLTEEQFRPLRLQNGWYVQRYAPMLRVAVPYGELSSTQLRVLARVAREYDQPEPALLAEAQATQEKLGDIPLADGRRIGTKLKYGYGHFTTRTNVQYNWVPIEKSADVMDLLASVDMHGIQTSGNCIRNITADAFAGIAPDEVADPRPFGEIMRQWSSLHPEFAFLPRKFKIAINGAAPGRLKLKDTARSSGFWCAVTLRSNQRSKALSPWGNSATGAPMWRVKVGTTKQAATRSYSAWVMVCGAPSCVMICWYSASTWSM